MLKFIWMNRWPSNPFEIAGVEEENIFSAEICEKEGERPWARILIPNPYVNKADYIFAPLGVLVEEKDGGKEVLFIGYTHAVEKNCPDETVTVHLMGGQNSLEASPPVRTEDDSLNLLFCEESTLEAFRLKRLGRLPYWNRTTGQRTDTDPLKGATTHELTPFTIKEQFIIKEPLPAPRMVCVQLTTEWMQRYLGETDLSYTVRTLFPGGLVNTLTADSLKVRWWKPGKRLGQSRYWVDHTYLQEISPPYTGLLNLYPATGLTYYLSPYDPLNPVSQVMPVTLKRRWFRTKIVLGWEYRQKRREDVNLTLKNSQGSENVKPLEISFSLKRVDHYCPDAWQKARGRFFTTDVGKKVLQIAMDLTRFHLKLVNRQRIVSLILPWNAGITLNVDASVTIHDEQLPNHQAYGKVISFKAVIEGETSNHWVELKIALIEGRNYLPQEKTFNTDAYELKEVAPVEEGIDYPMALSEKDIVQEARVTFGPHDQIEFLKASSYPHSHHLQNLLKEAQTDLHLVLRDISARPLLRRQYRLIPRAF